MKRSVFIALVIGALGGLGLQLAMAQPVDPFNPRFRNVTITNSLAVGNDLSVGDDLTVTDDVTITGDVSAALGKFDVADAGRLNVVDDIGVGDDVLVGDDVIATGDVTGALGKFTTADAGVMNIVDDLGVGDAITAAGTIQGNDVQVPTNRAMYFDGTGRTIGFGYNGTVLRVLGAAALTPVSDQNINLGSSSIRWSNAYFGGNIFNTRSTGTPASGTGITATYTSGVGNWVHKVVVTKDAMTAAATTDITLHVTPVNTRIIRVVANVTEVFDDGGGALSAVSVTCGNAAGGNQYLLAHSQLTTTGAFGDVAGEVGAGLLTATWADFGTVASGVPGAITVQCRYTCTGANCNAALTGAVTYYVEGVTY